MRAEQRADPRGELTPEIRDLLNRYGYAEREDGRIHERAATGATTWGAAEKSERCALEVRAALESAILALSGPPSGQESRDTVLLDWLETEGGESMSGLNIGGTCMRTVYRGDTLLGEGDTLREAIEDAISAEIVDEAGEGGFDTEERS